MNLTAMIGTATTAFRSNREMSPGILPCLLRLQNFLNIGCIMVNNASNFGVRNDLPGIANFARFREKYSGVS